MKNLPIGDGGAVVCSDAEWDARLRRLRWRAGPPERAVGAKPVPLHDRLANPRRAKRVRAPAAAPASPVRPDEPER